MKIIYHYTLLSAEVVLQVDDEILGWDEAEHFNRCMQTVSAKDPYDTMCRHYAAKILEIDEDHNLHGMQQAIKDLQQPGPDGRAGYWWRTVDGTQGLELLYFAPLSIEPKSFNLKMNTHVPR